VIRILQSESYLVKEIKIKTITDKGSVMHNLTDMKKLQNSNLKEINNPNQQILIKINFKT